MSSVMPWPVQTCSLGNPSIHLLAGGMLAFNWKAFLFIYIFQYLFLILISEDKSTVSSTKWVIDMTQNMKLAEAGVGSRNSLESKNVKPTWPPLTTIFFAMILLLFSLNVLLVVMVMAVILFPQMIIPLHLFMALWCVHTGGVQLRDRSRPKRFQWMSMVLIVLGFGDQCAQNPFLRSIDLCLFQCEYIITVKQDWWQLQQLQEIVILLWTQRCKNLFAGYIVNLYKGLWS